MRKSNGSSARKMIGKKHTDNTLRAAVQNDGKRVLLLRRMGLLANKAVCKVLLKQLLKHWQREIKNTKRSLGIYSLYVLQVNRQKRCCSYCKSVYQMIRKMRYR